MNIFDHFRQIVRNVPHPVLLEVGANRLEDSLNIIKCFPDYNSKKSYTYIAIEPNPENLDKIDKDFAHRWINIIVGAAISNYVGKAKLYQSSGNVNPNGESWSGSSSILPPKNHLTAHPWCKFEKTTEVKVITLDTLYKFYNLSVVDILWIDTQGSESRIIEGGQTTLCNTRYLYSEYNDHELYEGQKRLDEWLPLLPGKWEVVEKYTDDVLLKNLSFKDD